jgi:hypothetical protein
MSKNKYDVRPSVENKGLVYRAKISDGCTPSALKEHIAEVERATTKHLAVMGDADKRDIHVTTDSGLVLIGPSCGDVVFPFARAYNASMAAIDAKLAELDAKLAELAAAQSPKK